MRRKMIRPGPPPEVEKLYFSESDYQRLGNCSAINLLNMVIHTEQLWAQRAAILAELACKLGIDIIGFGSQSYGGQIDPMCALQLFASEPDSSFQFHIEISLYPGSWWHWKPPWTLSISPVELTDANRVRAKELTEVVAERIRKGDPTGDSYLEYR